MNTYTGNGPTQWPVPCFCIRIEGFIVMMKPNANAATGDTPINGCHPFSPNAKRSTPFRWTRQSMGRVGIQAGKEPVNANGY